MRHFPRAIIVALLAACSSTASDRPVRPLTVSIMFDAGGRGDRAFNDAAAAGAQRAARELGVAVRYVDPRTDGNRVEQIGEAMRDSVDLVIGVGFMFSEPLLDIAPTRPAVQFAGVDLAPRVDGAGQALPLPANVVGLSFREDEGAFLVGAIAGMTSRAKHVGFVGGMDIPVIHRFASGYAAGVKQVCPTCRVDVAYAGTTPAAFAAPEKGRALALAQYDAGADVVFHASGQTGQGVFRAAQQTGRYAIGVDIDQSSLAPGRVLTSMIKGVDVAVFETIRRAKAKQLQSGRMTSFGLAEQGVGYVYGASNRALIPDTVRARVESLRQAIIAGLLTTRQRPAVGTTARS